MQQQTTRPSNSSVPAYQFSQLNDIATTPQLKRGKEQNLSDVVSTYLTVISLLIATSSFVLGLYVTGRTIVTNPRYYKAVVVSIVVPLSGKNSIYYITKGSGIC